nr:depupylase/deamidase Dop [Bogoriella caseilytica]
MGIETEYGILAPGNPRANPVVLCVELVAAYTAATSESGAPHVPWDYAGEDPLADARGFRLDRAAAHPSQLTDDGGRATNGAGTTELRRPSAQERHHQGHNAVLGNGARLYVDHAHPEYSSPEVSTPREAVRFDRAGEEVMRHAAVALATRPTGSGEREVVLYKNNVDGKGASYGTHENYLVERSVSFGDLITYLTPFFVTRPIICGAGRVGLGQQSETPGFQISQRADYVENDVGLETTFNRPIINTRDEPHADPERWRRLHVIGGDANLFEVSTYLKLGTTALMLWLLESGEVPLELDALTLADPVAEAALVSHDVSLTHALTLSNGRQMTALEIQRTYLHAISEAMDRAGTPDQATAEVLARWRSVLGKLETDPASAAAEVEWVAKHQVLQSMRRREGLPWDHPKLAALDLQWHDLRPERSITARLQAAGRMETLISAEDVAVAVAHPPETTRAYFRGEVVRRYPGQIAGAGWQSVVFDIPGREHLVRVPMTDPLRGTRAHVEGLLDCSVSAEQLLAGLQS